MLVKEKSLYAIHTGDYAGQIFAFISKDEESYNFLAMPGMRNIKVPVKDLTEGLEKEIIVFVETPPDDVFEVIEAQYKKNENTND